jgi:hypothetical protein
MLSLRHLVQTGSGTHPTSYPMGTGGHFSLEVKRPGLEADHTRTSSVEVEECVQLYLRSAILLRGVVLN